MILRALLWTAALAALIGLVPVATPAEGGPTIIILKSGDKIFGRVLDEECTDQLLVVSDLRTRAKRSIPWDKVKAHIAHKHRVRLGFEAGESKGQMHVAGVKIVNRAGNVFVGVLLNAKSAEQEGFYRLKTADGERKIPTRDVRQGPDPEQVPSLQVYTPKELYELKIKVAPPASPEDHHRLADFCMLIGAWPEAKHHFEKVLASPDSKFNPEAVQRALDRVERLLSQQDALDSLRAVKREIVFNRFAKATERLAQFRAKYDDPDLLKEADKLDQARETARVDYYTKKVAAKVRDTVKSMLDRKVKEKKKEEWALSEAQKFAGGESSDQESVSYKALAKIAEDLQLKTDEVLTYWGRRPRRGVHTAYYRNGTFIVTQPADPLTGGKKKRGKKAGVKAPKPQPLVTPEQWWFRKRQARRFSDMRDFLYAWWAENSGMVDLQEPKEATCTTCVGKGAVTKQIQTVDGPVIWWERCPGCHTARVHRVVRFK